MNPFITYRDVNEKGELLYFILQKEFPHYQTVLSEQPIKVFVNAIPISAHRLWLVFSGVLRGQMIPSYQDVDKEIIGVMQNMADWFYENRILGNDKKYKKWKI